MEFSKLLKDLSAREPHFKSSYLELSDNLGRYLVKLLDRVYDDTELHIILNETGDSVTDRHQKNDLARLQLAVDQKEYGFVSHPGCQYYMEVRFYGMLNSSRMSNIGLFGFITFMYILFYPLLAILYILIPCKTQFQKFMRTPFLSFISDVVSFLTFLAIVLAYGYLRHHYQDEEDAALIQLYREYIAQTKLDYNPDVKFRSGDRGGVLLILLAVFTAGLLWKEIKQLYTTSFHQYAADWYNVMDFLMILLYITVMTIEIVSSFKITAARTACRFNETWSNIAADDETARVHFYWLVADRHYMWWYDPDNIFDGLYAIATILSFCRTSYLLDLSPYVGPLNISVGRIVFDILKFAGIFVIVFTPFWVSLINLYHFYNDDTLQKVSLFIVKAENLQFPAKTFASGYISGFQTLFFALFGYGESDYPDLGYFSNKWTHVIGYLIFGAFHVVLIVVLLNMLIAMMAKSYDNVSEKADTEWKFARMKMFVTYMRTGSTLSVPFNLIPSIKSLLYCFRGCICEGQKHLEESVVVINERSLGRHIEMTERLDAPTSKNNDKVNDDMSQESSSSGVRNIDSVDEGPTMQEESIGITYQDVISRIINRLVSDYHQLVQEDGRILSESNHEIVTFREKFQREMREQGEKISALTSRIETLCKTLDSSMASDAADTKL
ncbi:short transient receptor potential channel 7-like [Tubulanus polymorphus]|uniref:short transient receptor potential channel 7-like n=1 Tax=Tubulanus polymorphus TaxID=672921 RepID=UPI003DA2EC66